ncbi:MAG: hypothetical protein MJH09_08225 [Cetobacterium sp.]|nr:hypothetical protein [Cetobacterium sp.]
MNLSYKDTLKMVNEYICSNLIVNSRVLYSLKYQVDTNILLSNKERLYLLNKINNYSLSVKRFIVCGNFDIFKLNKSSINYELIYLSVQNCRRYKNVQRLLKIKDFTVRHDNITDNQKKWIRTLIDDYVETN